ncbi:hypothetical protein ACFY9N_05820 [Microbacterium sp. NPDC008134]|uniref:hypothetical protein n=1 Tax=Microbacterium sp. NPDC008134 TaxID=3364183 RepID=UPI0036EC2DBE
MSLARVHECQAIQRNDRYSEPPNLDLIEEHLDRLERLRERVLRQSMPNYELVNRFDEVERWLHMNLAYGEGNVAILIPLRESFAWGRAIYSAKQFRLASEAVLSSISELPTPIDLLLTELGLRPEWTVTEDSQFAHWRGRADVLRRLGAVMTEGRTRDRRAEDPEVRESFFEHVQAGYDAAVVAGHVGVSHEIASRWALEGEGDGDL